MGRPKSKSVQNGVKRSADSGPSAHVQESSIRPVKKMKLLDDSDEDSDADADTKTGAPSLRVNEEYARRFEYNKKREEKQRLEEKYGKGDESEDSEEGVEEDDAGELVTEALDAEISATLQALRSKDPRIYDDHVTFYNSAEEGSTEKPTTKNDASMTLKQYHTANLLEGKYAVDDEPDLPVKTYAQEQEETRQQLVKQMHEAAESNDEEEGGEDFMVAKSKPEVSEVKRVKITEQDVINADQDPEGFLASFMAARAWVPSQGSHLKPLESDDEDEEAHADEYEAAYNMYFEDTAGANEKLVSYARDAVASTTVRREEATGRRKAREVARAKREAEKRQKEEDLARLRRLKVEEMEDKVQKIRQIGGLKGREFNVDEWAHVLEADWSDDQWDEEMRKRFGDAYYEDNDGGAMSDIDGDGDDAETGRKSKKPKKPKFDDDIDIDIKDLVPDFVDDEDEKPAFTLSDEEDEEEGGIALDQDSDDGAVQSTSLSAFSKTRKQARADAKSAARRDRRLIEKLVDDNLEYEAALASKPKAAVTRFRYRETSPTTFGLTPRDILLASDAQLNEFAGLKKLAAFRDPAKKKKDKKHLSKKARLRQWRTDTFGDAEGPKGGFEVLLGDDEGTQAAGEGQPGEGSKKKKKRNRKKKAGAEASN